MSVRNRAAVVRDALKIDPSRFNVDGGAIAHGHPIGATGATGATGAILITKVGHSLRRTGLSRAVVSLCTGGGQGIALYFERTSPELLRVERRLDNEYRSDTWRAVRAQRPTYVLTLAPSDAGKRAYRDCRRRRPCRYSPISNERQFESRR